jgi:hypothetical protein
MSVSTLGLVDFRSDKERTARYTRQTRNAVRAQSSMQAQLTADDLAAAQRREAIAYQAANYPQVLPTAPPPGWYADPQGHPAERWWDGTRWTEHFKPVQLPPSNAPGVLPPTNT